MESILDSIKHSLGILEDYVYFDNDLILYINSVFATLSQLNVGPTEGFSIIDKTSKWNDYIGENKLLNFVQSYVHIQVKLLFDPPSSASVLTAMQETAKQYEWRILAETDKGESV